MNYNKSALSGCRS